MWAWLCGAVARGEGHRQREDKAKEEEAAEELQIEEAVPRHGCGHQAAAVLLDELPEGQGPEEEGASSKTTPTSNVHIKLDCSMSAQQL